MQLGLKFKLKANGKVYRIAKALPNKSGGTYCIVDSPLGVVGDMCGGMGVHCSTVGFAPRCWNNAVVFMEVVDEPSDRT